MFLKLKVNIFKAANAFKKKDFVQKINISVL